MSTLLELERLRAEDLARGEGLAFIIGPFRSGTTLLRKMLDSHPALCSPAETWFLLPLLNLWTGDGATDRFNPKQAATALRALVSRDAFLEAVRAFAGRIYDRAMPANTQCLIDKTPLYLGIAPEIAEVFPAAKFIVLARDPRSILWSRHTWKHMKGAPVSELIPGVARDVQQQASFLRSHAECSHLVSYEELCTRPVDALTELTDFLEVPFDECMIAYGDQSHHEGYGDETTREHRSPHVESLARWRDANGLNEAQQFALLDSCGTDALHVLHLEHAHADLERLRSTRRDAAKSIELHPAATSPTMRCFGDRRRVLFFLHPGRNSRDILLDMAEGFRAAGCDVLTWELGTLWDALQARPHDRATITADSTRTVHSWMQSNGVDLSIGMWANAFTALTPTERNGRHISYIDAAQSPHIMFWLDAPHWANGGTFHPLFRTPLLQSSWCFNLINNPATAAEMTQLFGFTNVAPLNYGINPDTFRPHECAKKYEIVMSIGPGDPPPTAMMLRELESDDPDAEAIRRDLAGTIRNQLRATALNADALVRECLIELQSRMLEFQLVSPHTPMLDRLVGVARAHPDLSPAADWLINRPKDYLSISGILRQLESWQRPFIISYLSRHTSCAVFGDAHLDAWGCRAERLGEIAYEDQSRAYSLGRVGLNVMRWQDDVGLNLKPFEIRASGAACVMSNRSGVEACFTPDQEIVVVNSPGEALVRIRALLEDVPMRDRTARAGRERTLRDHTWKQRAASLLSLVGQATRRWA